MCRIERENDMRESRGSVRNQKRCVRIARYRRNFFIAAMVVAVSMATCVFVMNSSAKEEHESFKYYTSIEIQEGDSLWALAEEYGATAYVDCNEYIAEVKEINHLQGDEIHSGQYLTIPYYSAEIK